MKLKVALVGAMLISTPASSQIFVPPFNMGPIMVRQALQPAVDRARRAAQQANGGNYTRSPSTNYSGGQVALPAVSFRYVSSPTRRRENLATFVKKSRAVDPAGAAAMEQLFAGADPISVLGSQISQFGLRTDNAADAYTVYWMTAWQAAHGDLSDFTRSQSQLVKEQSADALAATSEFRNASDATKQELAEALMVQAMLISSAVDTYKNNPAMMRQLGAAVRKGAKASGLDLDAMTLTDQGFVPSGKTGAADPAPGAAEQALAANAAATPPVAANDTSPPYILLAAAGGAGLGGVFLLGKMMGRRG
jgi:hypothetical protein